MPGRLDLAGQDLVLISEQEMAYWWVAARWGLVVADSEPTHRWLY